MRHFFALCIMRLLAYFLSCLLDQTNDLHTEIWTFFFYKNVQKVSVYNIVSKASFAYIWIHFRTFEYISIKFSTYLFISIHFYTFQYIFTFFDTFWDFFVISIILIRILAFCSQSITFLGISQILQITFQSQGQFTLRVAGERKKQKFLKNVHQRLHVNYFLLKEFFFSISAVLLVYLSSLRLSSDHCCLSVIQFPSLTDQL